MRDGPCLVCGRPAIVRDLCSACLDDWATSGEKRRYLAIREGALASVAFTDVVRRRQAEKRNGRHG